jgi:peptidoglycan/LPS O-acetylase OafA/YrhL
LAFLSIRVEVSSVLGRLCLYLGDASYSLYLFHAILLDLAIPHMGIFTLGDHSLVNTVMAFTMCFAFSLVMYHLVEKPCVLFGKCLTSNWQHPLKA